MRLELGAMRAAIREEFDDLDLLPGLDGLRIGDPRVVLAFGQLRDGAAAREGGGQQHEKRPAEQLQFTKAHGVSWGMACITHRRSISLTARPGGRRWSRRGCREFRAMAPPGRAALNC